MTTVTTATPPQPVPDQPAGGEYGYDWVGNRLNPPTGTNHMVYNAADQLTAWPGMHQYTYFPDGSMQEEKNADGSQVMKSYTYTADGLMASASFDDKTLTNTWDADKNRVGFSVDSTNHTFVYDTTAGIPAVVKEDGVYYVREPNGELLARVDGSNTGYYHFDELGSTRLLTDASGNVTDRYDYDAYGAVIAHEKLAGSVDQPYEYVGQLGYYTCWQEPGFGLMQLGVRFDDSEVGRFVQMDPSGDGLNWYEYVESAPTNAVDPDGESAKPNPDPRKFPAPWLQCLRDGIARDNFPPPVGMEKRCKGLTPEECWAKIARCIIYAESKDVANQRNTAGSTATGLFQIIPCKHPECSNLTNPCSNIKCGLAILKRCAKGGDVSKCKGTYTSIVAPPRKRGGQNDFDTCMGVYNPPPKKKGAK